MNVPPTSHEAWRDASEAHLRDGAAVRLAVIDSCLPGVVEAATAFVRCVQAGATVYFCGNGGSAADLVCARGVLVALSTSGRSERVVRDVVAAKEAGATTIGKTGAADSPVAALADVAVRVPSTATPFIQEAHIAIGHAICGVVQAAITPAVTGAP